MVESASIFMVTKPQCQRTVTTFSQTSKFQYQSHILDNVSLLYKIHIFED